MKKYELVNKVYTFILFSFILFSFYSSVKSDLLHISFLL